MNIMFWTCAHFEDALRRLTVQTDVLVVDSSPSEQWEGCAVSWLFLPKNELTLDIGVFIKVP